MRIAIEATLAQGQATGLGHYVTSLLQALAKVAPQHEYLLLHATPDWNGPDFGANFKPVSYYFGKQSLGIFFRLNHVLKREKADIFHATCTTGVPPIASIPCIATIHDLYPLIVPQETSNALGFFFRLLIRFTIRNSKHFICNSKFTASELQRIMGVPGKMITPIHLGPCVIPMPLSQTPDSEKKDPFILCVGALEHRKGQAVLLDGYRQALSLNPGLPPLVFVGPDRGDGRCLASKAAAEDLGRKVRFIDYLPDEELREYYRNASLFILPSLYEGFGIPLLEAFASGLPVMCSDIPVFREIGGEYPFYIKPEPESFRDGILGFFNQDHSSRNFAEEGARHLSYFSWEENAVETVKCYEKVLTLL